MKNSLSVDCFSFLGSQSIRPNVRRVVGDFFFKNSAIIFYYESNSLYGDNGERPHCER